MASTSRRCPKLKKIHKDGQSNLGEVNTTNCTHANQAIVIMVPSPAEKLPSEMFYQIFQNVGKKSLKISREVCSTWRNAIDNNSKLMKTLTFTIDDIKQFMDSHLSSKAESIRFIQPLKGTPKSVEDFFKKIGSTVEQVFFTFGEPQSGRGINSANTRSRQKLMFSMMLRFCTKLKSLTITSLDNNYAYIKDSDEDPRNSFGLSSIQSLSIIVQTAYLDDLRKLVLSLPNLRRFHLDCDGMTPSPEDFRFVDDANDAYNAFRQQITQKIFINLVFDHLRKYDGKLQEISLENTKVLSSITIIQLLLQIGKDHPSTQIKCQPVDLNCLVCLNDIAQKQRFQDLQLNQTNCQLIKNARVHLCLGIPETLEHFDIVAVNNQLGFCTNLATLTIKLCYEVQLERLEFIKHFKKLTELTILDKRIRPIEEAVERHINAQALFRNIGTLPALANLTYDGQGLDLNSIQFTECFPNLQNLSMRQYNFDLNLDLIYCLSKLNSLESLTLDDMNTLTDEHFTYIDMPRRRKKSKPKLPLPAKPAIACFNNLKQIHLIGGFQLSDTFLVDGLACCDELEKITLCVLKGQFSDDGLKYLQKARDFNIHDVSEAHEGKHPIESNDWSRSQGTNHKPTGYKCTQFVTK